MSSNNQSFQHSDSPWKDELVIERLQQQVSQLIDDAQQGALHIDESGFAKHDNVSANNAIPVATEPPLAGKSTNADRSRCSRNPRSDSTQTQDYSTGDS